MERLERPALDASWTEHMLVVPIKPRAFPHSAMPFTRPRSAADAMTRSLMPGLDGLGAHPEAVPDASQANGIAAMSRSSFASFHLTGVKNGKMMTSSVDRLFENSADGDVFLSSSYADFHMPAIQEGIAKSRSPDLSQASTPEHHARPHPNGGRETPPSTNNSTARSSRRDSLNDSNRTYAVPHQQQDKPQYASPQQLQHQSLDRIAASTRNDSPVHNRTVTSSPVLGGNQTKMQSPTNHPRVL